MEVEVRIQISLGGILAGKGHRRKSSVLKTFNHCHQSNGDMKTHICKHEFSYTFLVCQSLTCYKLFCQLVKRLSTHMIFGELFKLDAQVQHL